MQVHDLAFAREKVINDVEPLHGLEVATENSGGNHLGDLRSFISAQLDIVQRLETQRLIFRRLLVPLRHARVEVPTVVIEWLAASLRTAMIRNQLGDGGLALLVDVEK